MTTIVNPTGNFWKNSESLVSAAPGRIQPGGDEFTKAPADLLPSRFRLWNRQAQVDYIEAHLGAGGTPGQVTIGKPPTAEIFAVAPEKVFKFEVGNTTGTGFNEFSPKAGDKLPTALEQATNPQFIKPSTFFSWTSAAQKDYIESWQSRLGAAAPLSIGPSGGNGAIRVSSVTDVVAGMGVIQNTLGDILPLPYLFLSGTATGAVSPVITASAEALFPSLDGSETTLPVEDRPALFYTKITAATSDADKIAFLKDFADWHSGYQLEYIKRNGVNVDAGTTKLEGDVLSIKTSKSEMTAVISRTDPTKFFIMQALDKASFAKMSLDDQSFIVAQDGFAELASRVGLSSKLVANVGDLTVPIETRTNLKAEDALTNLKNYFTSKQPDSTGKAEVTRFDTRDANEVPAPESGFVWERTAEFIPFLGTIYTWHKYFTQESRSMPPEDRTPFVRQAELLIEQIAEMGVVSPADISKKMSELKDRFDRAFAFYEVMPPREMGVTMGQPPRNGHVYLNVISIDGDMSGITKGYNVFIAQEKRIANLAEERMKVARDSGASIGKHLDVPALVFKFQSLYNLQLEASVVMETEEINQQNDLLKTYARIQDYVNRTIASFSATDGDARALNNAYVDAVANPDPNDPNPTLSEEERFIMSMFEDIVGKGQKHPLEKLRNINRPLMEIFEQFVKASDNYDMKERKHLEWSGEGTRLSETVTIINQNSQLKMNDINSMDKQRNRHYELANGALSKMNDMIQSIARI